MKFSNLNQWPELPHVVCDGWSMAVVLLDLGRIYTAAHKGIAPQLDAPPQFSAYALEEAQALHSPEYEAAEKYWLEQFKDDVPVLIEESPPQELDLYVEWSRLDFKDAPRRDSRVESQAIVKVLEKRGYRPVTREIPDGTGWGGWRLRTDRILETLFPLEAP